MIPRARLLLPRSISFRLCQFVTAICALTSTSFPIATFASAAATSDNATAAEQALRQALLWGPYRPNLYFGVRPRVPNSLMTGVMWLGVDEYDDRLQRLRYTCEQHQLAGYGWTSYDPRTGGTQTLHDAANHIDVRTSFVKQQSSNSWAARISGTLRDGAALDTKTTVIFHAGLEGFGSLEVEERGAGNSEKESNGPVILKGETTELGAFRLEVRDSDKCKHPAVDEAAKEMGVDTTLVRSLKVQSHMMWQSVGWVFSSVKDTLLKKLGPEKERPPPWQWYTIENKIDSGNFHIVQKVFEGPFELDVVFSSGSSDTTLSSSEISDQIHAVTDSFDKRFGDIYKPKAPFTKARHTTFSQSLLSNLLGGIGYFYGDSRVDSSNAPEYEEENENFWEEAAEARLRNEAQPSDPKELFTSVPSRPFFPRGFLWDEGFHLMPIVDWDTDLALEIVKSWFSLMDSDGWIAREQILGPEARSKVPAEFQVQYPHYANPPTLFMVIDEFLSKLSSNKAAPDPTNLSSNAYTQHLLTNPAASRAYLENIYPLLKRHYSWFRRTQRGDLRTYPRSSSANSKEAYRWRGRTPTHILTSGLDDYPRPQPPHPGELHVDALTWIGVMARTLHRVATYLDAPADEAAEFAEQLEGVRANLDSLHWDATARTWCDVGWVEGESRMTAWEEGVEPVVEWIPVAEGEESRRVCHKGYVTILPWLVGLVPPESPRVGAVLDLVANEEELWSPHGLRSLSRKDVFYGTEENYWRGPVWVNMNYLAVLRLFELAHSKATHAARAVKLYNDLRVNLGRTVYDAWEASGGGFAYEQYDPDTGKGQRTEHFTGWTSLVVKILAMPEVEVQKGGKVRVRDEL